jgi:hypothetical protein
MRIARVDLGYWVLPKPETPKAIMWERIPILKKHIEAPFGYIVDPEDPKWYVPVPKELELLELAKKHLRKYSYRDVSAWITTQSGRSLSHSGLKTRIDSDRKRKRLIAIKSNYAKELKEVLSQIEKLEHQRIGAKRGATNESSSSSEGSS